MNKEKTSDKQGITMLTLYLMGSAIILPLGAIAGRDMWIAVLIAIGIGLMMNYLYGYLSTLYPNQTCYDMFEEVFGKYIGKIISAIYIWFALHLGSLVLRNFSEFMSTIALDATPSEILILFFMILCIWGVKSGMEVLGRFSEFFINILLISVGVTAVLLIGKMDIDNLKPVLMNGFEPIMSATFSLVTFPFAETVLFLGAFASFENIKSPIKVYTKGLLLAGVVLFVTYITDLLVLGEYMYSISFFPAYSVVSRLNIGDFLQRLEIIVPATFLVGGYIKISICLMSAVKGICRLGKIKDYRMIVSPVGILMTVISLIVYDNIMEMVEWAVNIWPYYAIVIELIIPVILLLAALIKKSNKIISKSV